MSKKAFLKCLKPLVLAWTLLAVSCGAPDPRTLPNLVATKLLIDVSQDFATQTFKLCFTGNHEMGMENRGPVAAGPFKVVLGFFDKNQNLVLGGQFDVPNGLAAGKTLRLNPLGQCVSLPFKNFQTGQTYFPGFWANRDQAVQESVYTDNIFLADRVTFR